MDDRDQSVNWTNDDLAFTELKGRSIGFVTGILGLSGMLWGLSQIKFEQPVQALPLTSTAPIASPTQVVQSAKTAKDWFDQANRKAEKQDFKGAIEDYSKAIKLKPDDAIAYYFRGLSSQNLGDRKTAIADYQKAADLYQQQGETQKYQDALGRIKDLQE